MQDPDRIIAKPGNLLQANGSIVYRVMKYDLATETVDEHYAFAV